MRSVFLRDCENCSILAACQQFRVRDNKDVSVFLACASEPIIETSKRIHFAPYQLFYPALKGLEWIGVIYIRQFLDQFRAAGLTTFNCSYSSIHDFTPNARGPLNYDFLPLGEDIFKHICLRKEDEQKGDGGVGDGNSELIPFILRIIPHELS